jgi:hypothetical protein
MGYVKDSVIEDQERIERVARELAAAYVRVGGEANGHKWVREGHNGVYGTDKDVYWYLCDAITDTVDDYLSCPESYGWDLAKGVLESLVCHIGYVEEWDW